MGLVPLAEAQKTAIFWIICDEDTKTPLQLVKAPWYHQLDGHAYGIEAEVREGYFRVTTEPLSSFETWAMSVPALTVEVSVLAMMRVPIGTFRLTA